MKHEKIIDILRLSLNKEYVEKTQENRCLTNENKNLIQSTSDIPLLANMQDFARRIQSLFASLDYDLDIIEIIMKDNVYGYKQILFDGLINEEQVYVSFKFSNRILHGNINLKIYTSINNNKYTNVDTIKIDIRDFYNLFIRAISSIIFYLNKQLTQ